MQKGDKFIFIGDSITEWGRTGDPEDIGTGYVRLIHDYLVTTYPNQTPVVLNRGVGGHRISDLAERWQRDVLDEKPAYVSISIGINDVWRQLDDVEGEQIYPNVFETTYQKLIHQVKEHTDAVIILMEPTIIEEDLFSEGNEKLKPYVEIVNKLAEQHRAILVRTHQAFVDFLKSDANHALTIDGVHTTSTGNMLLAMTWIKAFEQKMFTRLHG